MAWWRSTEHLEDHFRAHGTEVQARTVAEYDASAQETLEVGTYFEFWSDTVNETRIGCYHAPTRRFVILDLADRIVSHFIADARFIHGLPDNNYDG